MFVQAKCALHILLWFSLSLINRKLFKIFSSPDIVDSPLDLSKTCKVLVGEAPLGLNCIAADTIRLPYQAYCF